MADLMIFLAIHLIVPLAGLLYFLYLIVRMKKDKIQKPPIISLFIVFVVYGLLLLLLFTELFWHWSGMASFGAFFLILGTPIPMAVIAFVNWRRRAISKYHKWIFILGLAYFFIGGVLMIKFML